MPAISSKGADGCDVAHDDRDLDPIHFIFDASEADYLRYARLSALGQRPSSRDVKNPVVVRLADESEWKHIGVMDFVDNQLNARSGTIRAALYSKTKTCFYCLALSATCGYSAAT